MHYILYLISSECFGDLAQESDHVLTMLWARQAVFETAKCMQQQIIDFTAMQPPLQVLGILFRCSTCIVAGYTSNKNINSVTLSAMLQLLVSMVKGHHMSTLEVS